MKSLSNILQKITAVTLVIYQKHPQLYFLLNETPLFLDRNNKKPGICDFTQYLETLENQLKTFDSNVTLYPQQ